MAFGRDAASAAGMLTWGCLGLAALLVGISRIYLHVHYVSDVIAGAVLGLAWVLALNRLLKWAVHRI
jgi:undecaprenyl-diphosphatase